MDSPTTVAERSAVWERWHYWGHTDEYPADSNGRPDFEDLTEAQHRQLSVGVRQCYRCARGRCEEMKIETNKGKRRTWQCDLPAGHTIDHVTVGGHRHW